MRQMEFVPARDGIICSICRKYNAYGRRHGLFLNHRSKQFSWESCVAGIQNSVDSNVTDSTQEELGCSIMKVTAHALTENEELTPVAVGSTAQITTPASHDTMHALIQSLLLELPDLGPAVESELTKYGESTTVKQRLCLVKQWLPLLHVDVKNDQGMAFPPHMDRLHMAMLLKVDNERDMATGKEKSESEQFKTIPISTVFDIEEDPITAPPSPEPKPLILKEPPEHADVIISSCSDEDTGPSSAEARPEASSISDYLDCRSNEVQPKGPDGYSAPIITRNEPNKASKQEDHAGRNQALEKTESAITMNRTKSPPKSVLEDEFFPGIDDTELCNGADLQQACQMLEQVNALLVPCPRLGLEMDSAMAGRTSWHERLRLSQHQNLPPIAINLANEAELPWAPLHNGVAGSFTDESLVVTNTGNANQRSTPGLHADSQGTIQINDMFEDGELEEYPETIIVTEPKPPPQPSAFSSLIKLRLQENAAYQVPEYSQSGSLSSRIAATPVLPNTGDPGATSQLVSAFMALRGTKRPRLGRK